MYQHNCLDPYFSKENASYKQWEQSNNEHIPGFDTIYLQFDSEPQL